MDRIQKVSRILAGLCRGLVIFLPVLVAALWLVVGNPVVDIIIKAQPIVTPEGPRILSDIAWTPLTRSIGFLGSMVGMLTIIAGLYILRSIFHNYEKGEIFTLTNGRHYRTLGLLFFLEALLLQPLSHLLLVLAMTLSNPPGHRYITVSFGTPNVEAIFCGTVIIVISWVMIEAAKLEGEQKLII